MVDMKSFKGNHIVLVLLYASSLPLASLLGFFSHDFGMIMSLLRFNVIIIAE